MSNKGQSLVELAISFVVLMLLLSGAVEFGLIFSKFIQLRDAAQEGALYGSICYDIVQIEQRVKGASNTPLDLSDEGVVDIEIEIVENGDAIRVAAIHRHEIFMPFIPDVAGVDYIELRGEVVDTILTNECK